jgi:putative zinc finger protein
MTCRQFHQLVDRLVVGDLPPHEQDELREHAAACPDCAELWEIEKHLNAGITAQGIPEPSKDFESRIRNLALSEQKPSISGSWAKPVMGSAIAATLAMGLFFGMQMTQTGADQPKPELASTNVQNEKTAPQSKSVRLAFNSPTAMDNVTLTLEMPAHAELTPFPGRQTVSWKVDLKAGDNILNLPVNVLFPGSGKLVAHLDNGTRRKTFTTPIPGITEPTL